MGTSANVWLQRALDILFWILLVALVAPVVWMLLLSFRPLGVILNGLTAFFQQGVTLEHYQAVFADTSFLRWLTNSLAVSVTSTLLCITLGIFAGFYLGRMQVFLSQLVIILLLVAQVFPENLLVIPVFLLFQMLEIDNVYAQLIIAHVSFTLPLSTWLLANYIRQVPRELEEAARLDGAGWTQVVTRAVLPVIWPGIVASSAFAFITSWGDFIWGLLLGNRDRHFLLSVGIQQFSADIASIQWGILLAMAVLYTLPVVGFFFLVQSRLVRGLSSGALKG